MLYSTILITLFGRRTKFSKHIAEFSTLRPNIYFMLTLSRFSTMALAILLSGCVKDSPSTSSKTTTLPTSVTTEPATSQPTALTNRLKNGGFERGESWSRTATGFTNTEWATTGDTIYESTATFIALAGDHAQKIFGNYSGSVPNDSAVRLHIEDLTIGDMHEFTVQAMTHEDDRVSQGNHATAFLRFTDEKGSLLVEYLSKQTIDENSETSVWRTLHVQGSVPENATNGEMGIQYHLADWSSTGSVYLDEASWTSTGTGAVIHEKLLVWNDEFFSTEIDMNKWTHEVLPAYTYNNELQAYTNREENSYIEEGKLVINAIQEGVSSSSYSSARLNTAGKADWTYGRFEGSVMVPSGVGTWPALWMLPTDWAYGNWPNSGEIDIMEHVGCDPNVVHGTVHTGAYNHMIGTQIGGSLNIATATSAFHLYAIDWTPDKIDFSIDGLVYQTFENDQAGNSDTWPFDQAFHFVVNLAVGGDWGGYCGVDSNAFPQQYWIDWVRVYQ